MGLLKWTRRAAPKYVSFLSFLYVTMASLVSRMVAVFFKRIMNVERNSLDRLYSTESKTKSITTAYVYIYLLVLTKPDFSTKCIVTTIKDIKGICTISRLQVLPGANGQKKAGTF